MASRKWRCSLNYCFWRGFPIPWDRCILDILALPTYSTIKLGAYWLTSLFSTSFRVSPNGASAAWPTSFLSLTHRELQPQQAPHVSLCPTVGEEGLKRWPMRPFFDCPWASSGLYSFKWIKKQSNEEYFVRNELTWNSNFSVPESFTGIQPRPLVATGDCSLTVRAVQQWGQRPYAPKSWNIHYVSLYRKSLLPLL